MNISWLPNLVESLTEALPPGTNLARSLADLFDISPESAYRRLRGQTAFEISELLLLRKEFGISLDALADNKNSISIQMKPIFHDANTVEGYVRDLSKEFTQILSQSKVRFSIIAADLPFFRIIAYDALAAFKLFYWQKSILALDKYKHVNFSCDVLEPSTLEICHKLVKQYTSCASIEIWNEQTIKGTLKQIEYYADCAYFASSEELFLVYKDLIQLAKDVAIDAQLGYKRNNEDETNWPYELWNCELVMDNNSVLISNEAMRVLAIGFNSFNAFRCNHPAMLKEYDAWLLSMISRSTLISGQADKHRVQFIKNLIEKINQSASLHLPASYCTQLIEESELSG